MTSSNRLAVVSTTVLFCYYEIYRWIPLGPWNGEPRWPVRNDQFYPDIVIGLLLLWMIWKLYAPTNCWHVDRHGATDSVDWGAFE